MCQILFQVRPEEVCLNRRDQVEALLGERKVGDASHLGVDLPPAVVYCIAVEGDFDGLLGYVYAVGMRIGVACREHTETVPSAASDI